MKKILNYLFLAVILLLSPSDAHAMRAIFTFGSSSNNSANSVYWSIDSVGASSATELQKTMALATPVKLSNLSIITNAAPNNGADTIVYTVQVNGSPSAMTCTLTAAATTCSDTTNILYLNKGDFISIRTTSTGTPTFSPFVGYVLQEIENDNYSHIIGTTATPTSISNSATNYLAPFTVAPSSSESSHQLVMPISGDISKLYVKLSGAPDNGGGTQSYVLTVRKNSTDTALTCTISEAQTTCEDKLNSFSVTEGDLISISTVPSGTPTARVPSLSMVFRSSTPGYFIKSSGVGSTAVSTSVTHYTAISGAIASGTSAINQNGFFPANLYIRKLYAYFFTAPDNGASTQSYAVTLRNATAGSNTKSTCTVSETSQACTYTYQVSLPATEMRASYQIVPSGTPTASTVSIGGAYTLTVPAQTEIKGY